jgi:hypothetical protein
MSNNPGLLAYLSVKDYEDYNTLVPNQSPNWYVGHYRGMLNDLITILGREQLLEYLQRLTSLQESHRCLLQLDE